MEILKDIEIACSRVFMDARCGRFKNRFVKKLMLPFAWLQWHLSMKYAWRRRMLEHMASMENDFSEEVDTIPMVITTELHDEERWLN